MSASLPGVYLPYDVNCYSNLFDSFVFSFHNWCLVHFWLLEDTLHPPSWENPEFICLSFLTADN